MDRVRVIDTHLQFCRPLTARPRTEYAVVHHYGPVPAGFDLARIDADHVNDMHMRDRGWCGIGYHAVIKTDGTIEEGRPEWAMGAHDEGENARSLGILVVGDFRTGHPNARQVIALQLWYADKCEKYGWRPLDCLYGHRDNEPASTPTECPGDNLYNLLPLIRQVAQYMVVK